MKKILFVGLALTALFATSCKDKKAWKDGDLGPFTVHFDNRWGDHEFVLGQEETTPNGEKVKITTLNYFISNLVLHNENGSKFVVPQDKSYFLTKESDAASGEFEIPNVPAGNYTGITFTLGVDSLRNTKDVSERTGALDIGGAAADMYWGWNSGYIFYKIEGT